MKLSKKLITLFAAVLAVALLVPCALAAGETAAEPGKTAEVTFTFTDVYNVDGAFAVSDPDKIVSTYSINVVDAGTTAAVVNGNLLWASPVAEPVRTSISVKVTLSIKSTAAAGSGCTVSFSGIYGDANEEAGNEHDVTKTAAVTVKAPAPVPTPTPTSTPSAEPTPGVTPTKPVEPTPTPTPSTTPAVEPTPSVTPAKPTPTPTPTPPVVITSKVDYTELEKQITIADGLNPSDYTDESRNLLAAAQDVAQNALNSDDQAMVAAAAEELRTTIAGLKRMDYSALKTALSRAEGLLIDDQAAVIWQHLSEAAERGGALLQSGDQQAVDRAADELSDLLGRVDDLLQVETETKVVIQEVPVEVLPSGDYCNITSHRVWPVVAVCSLAVNLILLSVIVGYVIRKTKNRKDDTPLVDYDIDDDF